ncbi:DUF1127 domain-containing protein [Salinarimonas ramus]|uniref:YjiS-like domain-containing protein n=1 Tax=Salinarimonas ramus TaxID=690164 RepID=A0A917QDH8_9HYPH|nr:DUF1127 domain-containing protein [Salinarimonas ramus]GGK43350.1 hypothetical protein GCM10011322_33110 [Salinarimonas ramus]
MSTTCLDTTRATSVPLVSRTDPSRSSLVRMGAGFRAAYARIARAIRMRRAERILHEMPDHILHDIGIARGDIHDAIRNGRPWRDEPRQRL